MLALGRTIGERIIIQAPGQNPIVVEVVQVGGKQVRLAFEADPSVKIDREEVYKSKQAGMQAAG